ncbi:MAG: hypothetical protein P8J91_12950 [Pirellulaceae bacterium]|nr:hypothetical protein [Pirellulaceae bacterium]MDG2104652.1 hypothetical protein [Pirellulaceae bacterium]
MDVRDSGGAVPQALFLVVLEALALALANPPRSCLGQADRIQVSWFCREVSVAIQGCVS